MSKVDDIYKVTNSAIYGFFREHRFLSNFHLCDVWWEGLKYPSSENAYQSAKVISQDRIKFLTCSPAESKYLWKTCEKLYTPSDWDRIKVKIMYRILTEKFLSNFELFERLQDTGTKYLEETNWWGDNFWGNGDSDFGDGQNMLGKCLMHIRNMPITPTSSENVLETISLF
jgi:ribA/ribD-fused uncharacterized protein